MFATHPHFPKLRRALAAWAGLGISVARLAAQGLPSAAHASPDIHDIHSFVPLTFWEQYGLNVVLGSLAAILLIGWLTWRLLRKKMIPPLTPIERARQELAAARAMLASGEDKAFAIAVSDAVRHYLENAYNMPAPERTTEEFLQEAARHAWLQGELTVRLRRFLEFCDLTKFAGQQCGATEREQLLGAASEFVEAAERLRAPPAPAAKGAPPPLAVAPTGGWPTPSSP
jgi:hypothetical protein